MSESNSILEDAFMRGRVTLKLHSALTLVNKLSTIINMSETSDAGKKVANRIVIDIFGQINEIKETLNV